MGIPAVSVLLWFTSVWFALVPLERIPPLAGEWTRLVSWCSAGLGWASYPLLSSTCPQFVAQQMWKHQVKHRPEYPWCSNLSWRTAERGGKHLVPPSHWKQEVVFVCSLCLTRQRNAGSVLHLWVFLVRRWRSDGCVSVLLLLCVPLGLASAPELMHSLSAS